MWTLPGVLLWIPIAVHVFVGADILLIAFDRIRGHHDGFDFVEALAYIVFISVPVAAVVGIGWFLMAILKRKVSPHAPSKDSRGCRVLGVLAVSGPLILFVLTGMMSVT